MCENIHWADALLGGVIGLALALGFDYVKNNFFLHRKYRYFSGVYLHGQKNSLTVEIKHQFGELFEINGVDENNIPWRGTYRIIGNRMLNGLFDYNYLNNPQHPNWGEHHIHLLPDDHTIHVIGITKCEPIRNFNFLAKKSDY